MQKTIQQKLGAPVTLKAAVYRATAVMFVIQIFGALGAGFVFVTGSILGIEIPVGKDFWQIFLHLCFWATDFAFVGFTLALAYLIAGIPAIAPALTLSLFYSHFAGLYSGAQLTIPLYADFFVPPTNGAGGQNIGYMGFLFIALGVGYGIRGLYTLWNHIKNKGSVWLDKSLNKAEKLKDFKSIGLLEGTDLVVLILILPIVTALVTYFAVQYLVAVPFKALGESFEPIITELFAAGKSAQGGLLMGLLVGADTIGPLSMSAFRAATAASASGDAMPMTAYALAFAATGWICFAAFLMNKIFKRGCKMDTDDLNLTLSGPVNVLFDNMKLTVAFGMPFAYRSPFSAIPGTIAGCALTALLACVAGLSNAKYVTQEYIEKFRAGDYYVSFAQPHLMTRDGTNNIWLTLAVISGGVIAGAAVVTLIRELIFRAQQKRGTYEETAGDIVLELRALAGERAY